MCWSADFGGKEQRMGLGQRNRRMTGNQALGRSNRCIANVGVRGRNGFAPFVADNDTSLNSTASHHQVEIAYGSIHQITVKGFITGKTDRLENGPQFQWLAVSGQPHARA